MKKKTNEPANGSELRRRAEKQLRQRRTKADDPLTQIETVKLLHELQVHQIELEMQNEEMRLSRFETEETLARYTELYDFAPAGYFTLNKHGNITEVNLAGATLLGKERSWLIGKNLHRFLGIESLPIFAAFLARVFSGEARESCEVRLRRQGAQPIFAQIDAARVPVKEECRVMVLDITERQQAEEKIENLNRQLTEKVRLLEEANLEMESFGYSISHDLRAPLRIIGGLSEIVLNDYQDKLDDQGKKLLQLVHGNTKRMDEMVQALLNLTRIGRKEIRPVTIDMKKAATLIGDDLIAVAPDRRIDIRIADLPPARGDLTLIRQVLTNLLSNAVKFTRDKEVAVIEVGGRPGDGENIYFVKDNGAGFDMEFKDRLFKVFQRLHTVQEFDGVGIGLSIVHRIVKRHGGRSWVEAKPNEGATFYFSLPEKT